MTLLSPVSAAGSGKGPSRDGVIVWVQRTDVGVEHLVIANADGSHQRWLTPAIPGTADIDAQVSPSGRWIAYHHGTPTHDEVRLVRPDGTDDHLLDVGCDDPCGGVGRPTWISDNRLALHISFGPLDENDNAASAVLFTARRDGTHVRRLSEPGIDGLYEDRYARLSGNGRYLTFQRLSLDQSRTALFRMALDGTHVRQLTAWSLNADLYDLSTARSGPTKDLIVFQSVGRGDLDATWVDVGFVPANCASLSDCTSKVTWMTDNGATGRRTSNPQWSPDGSSIVFADRSSIDNPNAEVWTTRYRGTDLSRRNISNSTSFDFRPAWGRKVQTSHPQ